MMRAVLFLGCFWHTHAGHSVACETIDVSFAGRVRICLFFQYLVLLNPIYRTSPEQLVSRTLDFTARQQYINRNMMIPEENSDENITVNERSFAAQKTPASLLLELCMQQGMTAEYKLMSVEGPVHDPKFMYRVQVGNVEATATGNSKKKAKHAAAKAALEKLLSDSGSNSEGFVSEGMMVNSETLDSVVAASTLGVVSETSAVEDPQGNFVAKLQELCMSDKEQFTPPHYETKEEVGPAHERTFTIECLVERIDKGHVESFTELGTGKSKRLAKRMAAEILYDKLKIYEKKGEKKNAKKTTGEEKAKKENELISEKTNSEKLLSLDPSEAKSVNEWLTSVTKSVSENLNIED